MTLSFEKPRNELEHLFINELPCHIDTVNRTHNDGIILPPFTNRSLHDEHLVPPYWKLTTTSGERQEKDILLESMVWTVKLELVLPPLWKDKDVMMDRYLESLELTFKTYQETEARNRITITVRKGNELTIQIVA